MTGRQRHYDGTVIAAATLLVGFGTVMVYSSSTFYAMRDTQDPYYFLKRHVVYAAVGAFIAFLATQFDYRVWRKLAYPLLVLTLVSLVLVLFPAFGMRINGARRWLRLASLSFQPGELAKFAAVLYLAHSLTRKVRTEKLRTFSVGFLPHVLVVGTLLLLLLLQPDFGTSMIVAVTLFVMLFLAGTRQSYSILSILLVGLPGAAWLILKNPERLSRVKAFVDPWKDPYASGYHIIQSFIAFGSGGLFGRGLGDSRQKLFFLPYAHTDFVLPVVGEELGLIGVAAVVLLFLVLILAGLRVAARAEDHFGCFLAGGITFLIGVEAFTNMAVVMGLLPTKGLALPFISYGGSALVITLLMVGVLVSVSARPTAVRGRSEP